MRLFRPSPALLNGHFIPKKPSRWRSAHKVRSANDDLVSPTNRANHLTHSLKLHSSIASHDARDCVGKIADVVYHAKSKLAEHVSVHTITARVSYPHDFPDVAPATGPQRDETYNAEETRSPSCIDEGGATKPTWSSEVLERRNDTQERTRVQGVSGGCPGYEQAVFLRNLLQELDLKLLSITQPSSTSQGASKEAAPPISEEPFEQKRGQLRRGVVVALGSNIGNRVEEIEKACRAIDADPEMRIVDTSFLYETKPMYVEDQDHFVNGACEIETSLSPIQLLDRLQAIEQAHGRVKLVDKGPRNIDLDIAIFRDEVVDSERLTIPHMLMHEREFVLRPIMDLDATRLWENPRTKERLLDTYNWLVTPSQEPGTHEPMNLTTPLTADAMIYPKDRCRHTRIMSILNTTPDSFSDGEYNTLDPEGLRATAAAHIAAGATIIDVGGQSSRPNAPDITPEEEISRVLPAIAAIKSLPEAAGVAISVDTYRAAVAEAAVNAGAHIVNDISAGAMDPRMLPTVARLGCTYIMMHMRGTPATMQSPENCLYNAFSKELKDELHSRVTLAVASGIRSWRIILDPGIGFAKTQEHNLFLLRNRILERQPSETGSGGTVFKKLSNMPQLIGCSRKGFIGAITGVEKPKDRLWGTAAAVTASIGVGADIVRVHDVEEMAQVVKMADAIYRTRPPHR